MTLEEDEALLYKRVPGALDTLSEEKRERIKGMRDVQLDRAIDLLKGINKALELQARRHPANGKLAGR